ncbi:MAG: hypothetical protein HYR84_03550 [Planctomycetes bacterium]|nr:hypothetical protein [Planctomycetota bacterium]
MTTKLEGGFRVVSTRQICMVWSAYRDGTLAKLLDVRVYWALHEIADRRDAAMRAKRRAKEPAFPRQWPRDLLVREVQRLVHSAAPAPIRASLRRLEAAGLVALTLEELRFADAVRHLPQPTVNDAEGMLLRIHPRLCVRERAFAFPRRMLRHLAASGGRCLHATVLAHLIRCLWRKGDSYSNVGSCSSRFVSELFGVDPRNVKRARASLRSIGWLLSPEADNVDSTGHSAWSAIDLGWTSTPAFPARNTTETSAISPPLHVATDVSLPPPIRELDLPSGSKNQYPRPNGSAGVRERIDRNGRASLADVRPADLRTPTTLCALFHEAASAGLVHDTTAHRTRFVTAATHAVRVGTRNPCGLFVTVLRKGLWNYLSQADEDAARSLLADPVWHSDSVGMQESDLNPPLENPSGTEPATAHATASIAGLVREISRRWSVNGGESAARSLRSREAWRNRTSDVPCDLTQRPSLVEARTAHSSASCPELSAAARFPTEFDAIVPCGVYGQIPSNGMRLGTRSALARPDSRSELGEGRRGEPKARPADGIREV